MNTLGNIVATVLCLWFGGIILVAAFRHFRAKAARLDREKRHLATALSSRPTPYGLRDKLMARILEARLDE